MKILRHCFLFVYLKKKEKKVKFEDNAEIYGKSKLKKNCTTIIYKKKVQTIMI